MAGSNLRLPGASFWAFWRRVRSFPGRRPARSSTAPAAVRMASTLNSGESVSEVSEQRPSNSCTPPFTPTPRKAVPPVRVLSSRLPPAASGGCCLGTLRPAPRQVQAGSVFECQGSSKAGQVILAGRPAELVNLLSPCHPDPSLPPVLWVNPENAQPTKRTCSTNFLPALVSATSRTVAGAPPSHNSVPGD